MTKGREINFSYILSTPGTPACGFKLSFTKILLMHRENVYNKIASEEGRKQNHLCSMEFSIVLTSWQMISQILGATMIKNKTKQNTFFSLTTHSRVLSESLCSDSTSLWCSVLCSVLSVPLMEEGTTWEGHIYFAAVEYQSDISVSNCDPIRTWESFKFPWAFVA